MNPIELEFIEARDGGGHPVEATGPRSRRTGGCGWLRIEQFADTADRHAAVNQCQEATDSLHMIVRIGSRSTVVCGI